MSQMTLPSTFHIDFVCSNSDFLERSSGRRPSPSTSQESCRAVERSPRARKGLHIELKYVVHALPHLQRDRCACFAGLDSVAARIVEENFLTADLNNQWC